MSKSSLAYVESLPQVQDLIGRIGRSKIAPLFAAHRDAFMTVSAATSMHHNFTHGLVLHTCEVLAAADAFRKAAPLSAGMNNFYGFTDDELFVAVVLHDFAKVKQYEPGAGDSWKKVRMICNQEVWTLNELAGLGVKLSDNELVGLLGAEGGYSEFEVEWCALSAIVHAADLWSSQAMRVFWDPAAEMHVMCQNCGSPMAIRNGPRGEFYGCTSYPKCRGIKNLVEVPAPADLFLDFLKRCYPLPASEQLSADIESGKLKAEDLPF